MRSRACVNNENCAAEDFMRASGECKCPTCGLEYWRHPYCNNSYSDWADAYTLHRLCDGRHVKL